MLTEKDTIRCEAVYNDERNHRYLWKRVWDKSKPLAAVIMLNPCMADTLVMDTTTCLVVNNVARLEEYGGVEIVNLFSMLTNKLNFRWYGEAELNGPENDSYIRRAATECATVILAWGRTQDTNQHIADRVLAVLKLLDNCKEKLRIITDGRRSGIHPLTPSIRAEWILETFQQPQSIGPAARRAAAAAHNAEQQQKNAVQATTTSNTPATTSTPVPVPATASTDTPVPTDKPSTPADTGKDGVPTASPNTTNT